MKITLNYSILDDSYENSSETFTWEGMIEEDDYSLFQENKDYHQDDYQDLKDEFQEDFDDLEDPKYDSDDSVQNDYVLELANYNYEVLEEALPNWCEHAISEILAYQNSQKPDALVTENNLIIDGCYFENDMSDASFSEGDVLKLTFKYFVEFGKNDYSDFLKWETEIPFEKYVIYSKFIKSHPSMEGSFETLEHLFPEWSNAIYSKLVDFETDSFRDNEDPDDWGCGEDMQNPEWRITDTYYLNVKKFCISK